MSLSGWRARGELAFPGIGRLGVTPALTELQRIAELERKIFEKPRGGRIKLPVSVVTMRWTLRFISPIFELYNKAERTPCA